MNVLLVYSTPYPEVRGGVDTVLITLMEELKREHSVALFQAGTWDQKSLSTRMENGIRILSKRLRLPLPSRSPLADIAGGAVEFVATFLELRRELRRSGIEVVHLHTLKLYHLYFALCAVFGGPPYVVTLHGSEVPTYRDQSRLKRIIWRMILRRASRVTAVSDDLRKQARQTFPFLRQVDAIENAVRGIDKLMPKAELEKILGGAMPERYFAAVGSLESYKGHEVAIRAMALVHAEAPDMALLIAGDGSQRQAYEETIQRLRLPGKVRLLGALPQAAVHALMAHSLCVVMPSHREGFPLVPLEAVVLGCPIIASDIESLRRIVGPYDRGILFESGSSDACAQAMLRCIETARPDTDRAPARHGPATPFSPELMARSYLQAYRSAIAHAG